MVTNIHGTHLLPDVLESGLLCVFCGTAAGKRSAEVGAYYAHPGNLFWRALHECGLTPQRIAPADFHTLPRYGLGLTDLAKHHAGNDNELPRDAFDVSALRSKIEFWRPAMLAFTSKAAARIALGHAVNYGLQTERWGRARVFVLPSPSGQARGHWSDEPWRTLAECCQRARPSLPCSGTALD